MGPVWQTRQGAHRADWFRYARAASWVSMGGMREMMGCCWPAVSAAMLCRARWASVGVSGACLASTWLPQPSQQHWLQPY